MRGSGFQLSTLCGSIMDCSRRKHAYTLKCVSVSRVWITHLVHAQFTDCSKQALGALPPAPRASRKGDLTAVLWEELLPRPGPCRPESEPDVPDSRPAVSSR